MAKEAAVYILASQRNGTLYVGVTGYLALRVWQHRSGLISGFTQRYKVHQLVYFEFLEDMMQAIAREKRLKKFSRREKLELIETRNPDWIDLWSHICD